MEFDSVCLRFLAVLGGAAFISGCGTSGEASAPNQATASTELTTPTDTVSPPKANLLSEELRIDLTREGTFRWDSHPIPLPEGGPFSYATSYRVEGDADVEVDPTVKVENGQAVIHVEYVVRSISSPSTLILMASEVRD